MRAVGRFVIVKCLGSHAAKSSIVLLRNTDRSPNLIGEIIAVGVDVAAADARLRRNGDVPSDYVELKVGDKIVFNRSGTRGLDQWAYIAVEHQSIIGILEPGDEARAEQVKHQEVEEGYTQEPTAGPVSVDIGETNHHKLSLVTP